MRDLAARLAREHAGLLRFGYFGSYARGEAGPGSDVDLVAVVKDSGRPFHERPLDFDVAGLPVPAEVLVYTIHEWRAAGAPAGRFIRQLQSEAVWVFP